MILSTQDNSVDIEMTAGSKNDDARAELFKNVYFVVYVKHSGAVQELDEIQHVLDLSTQLTIQS